MFNRETSRSVEVEACDCKRDGLWVRIPLGEFKHLIFSFFCSRTKAKRGFEFRHSTNNAFRIWGKVGNGSVLIFCLLLFKYIYFLTLIKKYSS